MRYYFVYIRGNPELMRIDHWIRRPMDGRLGGWAFQYVTKEFRVALTYAEANTFYAEMVRQFPAEASFFHIFPEDLIL